jgi:hypothetical protein
VQGYQFVSTQKDREFFTPAPIRDDSSHCRQKDPFPH